MLSDFFADSAIKPQNEKYAASKRYVNADGVPLEWELCAITTKEDEEIRRACTKKVPVPGKRGVTVPETDFNMYNGKLAARCTVFPNLDDIQLQNSYGVLGAEELLKVLLTPGEYTDYLLKVQEINGFSVAFDELVEEAKN
jgi:hypothetical protein